MKIIRSIRQMSEISGRLKLKGRRIGFVPTMGALHEGHLSLIRQARQDSDFVVVSIFVNPIQFAPSEDFHKYPRNLKRDAALCRKAGVDIIFYPNLKDTYKPGHKTYVLVEGLSNYLCGKSRPGHFKGVATIVTKLFNIVHPDTAYFGQKDAQQAIIIKRLSQDLNMPVQIKVMPIVRAKDGLALSSRNVYLSLKERKEAVVLYQSLSLAKFLVKGGACDSNRIISRIKQLIHKKKSAKIDYVSILDANTIEPVKKASPGCLIALAVWIGKTRLIDNLVVSGEWLN